MHRTVSTMLGKQSDRDLPLGGPGSGHYGHAGRPGLRGGSFPADVAVSIEKGRTAVERQTRTYESAHGDEWNPARLDKEMHKRIE